MWLANIFSLALTFSFLTSSCSLRRAPLCSVVKELAGGGLGLEARGPDSHERPGRLATVEMQSEETLTAVWAGNKETERWAGGKQGEGERGIDDQHTVLLKDRELSTERLAYEPVPGLVTCRHPVVNTEKREGKKKQLLLSKSRHPKLDLKLRESKANAKLNLQWETDKQTDRQRDGEVKKSCLFSRSWSCSEGIMRFLRYCGPLPQTTFCIRTHLLLIL